MGNQPPNIDRFVRLMSRYLPIRCHTTRYDIIYVEGCNYDRLTYPDWFTGYCKPTLAGHAFWMICSSLDMRYDEFPEIIIQISTKSLIDQIYALVSHCINGRNDDCGLLSQFITSIDRRLRELHRHRVDNQREIQLCELMIDTVISMSIDSMTIYLLSQQLPPSYDEIPSQPTQLS